MRKVLIKNGDGQLIQTVEDYAKIRPESLIWDEAVDGLIPAQLLSENPDSLKVVNGALVVDAQEKTKAEAKAQAETSKKAAYQEAFQAILDLDLSKKLDDVEATLKHLIRAFRRF